MELQQTTSIPEVKDTIVMLRELSADEKLRQEVYYREKRLHDEATALNGARREGRAEGRAEFESEIILTLYGKGKLPKQISDDLDIPLERVLNIINNEMK